jgi:acyl-coenzyme A synthetase/AMP-(fatty) acid ligase
VIEVPDRYNVADAFVDRHIREGRGGRIAVTYGPRQFTYAEIAEQINRAGNALLDMGIQEEQRVTLLLPDIPDFVVAYFAAMKIGAVAVPPKHLPARVRLRVFPRRAAPVH